MLLVYLGKVFVSALIWHLARLVVRRVIQATIPLNECEVNTDKKEATDSTTTPSTHRWCSPRSVSSSLTTVQHQWTGGDTKGEITPNDEVDEVDEEETAILHNLRTQGPSYYLSSLHALALADRGLRHMARLWYAPALLKLYHPGNLLYPAHSASTITDRLPYVGYLPVLDDIAAANRVFTSYLLSDLAVILVHYPSLGGMDMVVHHCVFALCALVAGYYQINTFMFTWIAIGEASTPLLNLRWFILTIGKKRNGRMTEAAARWLAVIEPMFGALFFITRVCVYSAGMVYQMKIMPMFPKHLPRWAVYSTFGLVVVGFGLNLTWMWKITGILLCGVKGPTGHHWSNKVSKRHSDSIGRGLGCNPQALQKKIS